MIKLKLTSDLLISFEFSKIKRIGLCCSSFWTHWNTQISSWRKISLGWKYLLHRSIVGNIEWHLHQNGCPWDEKWSGHIYIYTRVKDKDRAGCWWRRKKEETFKLVYLKMAICHNILKLFSIYYYSQSHVQYVDLPDTFLIKHTLQTQNKTAIGADIARKI